MPNPKKVLSFEAPYKRLPSRRKAKGQLVSFVIPLRDLRAARAFALRSRWPVSEVFRQATQEFLARQASTPTTQKEN